MKKRLPGRKRLSRKGSARSEEVKRLFLSPSAVRSRLVPEESTKI
jgi:hypothetical protein